MLRCNRQEFACVVLARSPVLYSWQLASGRIRLGGIDAEGPGARDAEAASLGPKRAGEDLMFALRGSGPVPGHGDRYVLCLGRGPSTCVRCFKVGVSKSIPTRFALRRYSRLVVGPRTRPCSSHRCLTAAPCACEYAHGCVLRVRGFPATRLLSNEEAWRIDADSGSEPLRHLLVPPNSF